ncbi:MAG: hypothetical protein ACO2O4_05005 [Minisyncoccia bacterium]|jgi:hypothetical protein
MEVIKLGYKMSGNNVINAPNYIQGIENATENFMQSIINEYNKQSSKKIINYEVIAINEIKGNYINFAKVNLYSNNTTQSVGAIVSSLFNFLIANWKNLIMAGLVSLALFGLLKVDRIKISSSFGSIELSKNGSIIRDLPPDSEDGSGIGDGSGSGSDGNKSENKSFPIWLRVLAVIGYFVLKRK